MKDKRTDLGAVENTEHWTRRGILHFFALLPGLFLSGCQSSESPREQKLEPINLGAVSALPEGESTFSVYRLLVRRSGNELSAMSLVCTHQSCLVGRTPHGFACPCHGSLFSRSGAVLKGPAVQPLVFFRADVNSQKELLVYVSEPVEASWKLDVTGKV